MVSICSPSNRNFPKQTGLPAHPCVCRATSRLGGACANSARCKLREESQSVPRLICSAARYVTRIAPSTLVAECQTCMHSHAYARDDKGIDPP
jgi:hypothetical protein